MIVRILGEGQYEVPDDAHAKLDELDDALVKACESGEEPAFAAALAALTDEVRRAGQALADDDFAPSDLVVPFADATLEETRALLADASDGSTADDS
jgi:hypothetical protein